MLTINEVAKQTGKAVGTVRNWISSGKLKATEVDGCQAVTESDLAAFLEGKEFITIRLPMSDLKRLEDLRTTQAESLSDLAHAALDELDGFINRAIDKANTDSLSGD